MNIDESEIFRVMSKYREEMKQMKQCALCESSDLEQVEDHLVCKNCGMGYRGTASQLENMTQEHLLDDMFERIKILKLLFPGDSSETLSIRYSLHEHRVSKHPTDKYGYCEWCDRNWKKMSKEEFKELLGYEKSKWIEGD